MPFPCPNCGEDRDDATASCLACGWERVLRTRRPSRAEFTELTVVSAALRGARTGFIWVAVITFSLFLVLWLVAFFFGLGESGERLPMGFGALLLVFALQAVQLGILGAVAGAFIYPMSLGLREASVGTQVAVGTVLLFVIFVVVCCTLSVW